MALITKDKKLVVESEKQFWNKAIKLAQSIDRGKKPIQVTELSFPNLETLRKTLTPKRLQIIKEIKHKQPESVYDLARIMKTDYKNLIREVNKLNVLGLIDIKKNGKSYERKSYVLSVNFDSLEIKIPV